MALGDFFAQFQSLLFGGQDVLRNRRHQPRLALDLAVVIDLQHRRQNARICDFGPNGLRLCLPERLHRNRRLQVEVLPDAGLGGSPSLNCRVAWCKPCPDGSYQIGCRYDDSPEALATSWVQMLLLDRHHHGRERKDRRVEATIPAVLLDRDQPAHSVFVLDLGLGGARVYSAEAWSPGVAPRLSFGIPGYNSSVDFSVDVVESKKLEPAGFSYRLRFKQSDRKRQALLRQMLMHLLEGVRKAGRERPADIVPPPPPPPPEPPPHNPGKLGAAVRAPRKPRGESDSSGGISKYLVAPDLPQSPRRASPEGHAHDPAGSAPPPRTPAYDQGGTAPPPRTPAYDQAGSAFPSKTSPLDLGGAAFPPRTPAYDLSEGAASGVKTVPSIPALPNPWRRQLQLLPLDSRLRKRGWLSTSLEGWYSTQEVVSDFLPRPSLDFLRCLGPMVPLGGLLGWQGLWINTDLDVHHMSGPGLLWCDRATLGLWWLGRRGLISWLESSLRQRQNLEKRILTWQQRALHLLSLLAFGGKRAVHQLLVCSQIAQGIARSSGLDDPNTLEALSAAALLKDLGEALLFIASQSRATRDRYCHWINGNEWGETSLAEVTAGWEGFQTPPDYHVSRLKIDPISWELMPLHPWLSSRALQQLGFPAEITTAVRYHHEGWSGLGHPEGLAEQEIPWSARCLALADAFASDLSFSEDPQHSFEAVVGLADHAYDPALLQALYHYLKEIGVVA